MKNILKDVRNLARDPLLHAVYLPVQLTPFFRPGGLWYESEPTFGRSVLFAIPGPYHPLEVLAAVRGAWPIASEDYTSVYAVGEARRQKLYTLKDISQALYITTETAALLFHLFTPLNTNVGPPTGMQTVNLFRAAGLTGSDAVNAMTRRTDGPCRRDFWTGHVRVDYNVLLESI